MIEEISQMLGRIEGKLDMAISSAEEHRRDDTRRFEEILKQLGAHEKDINQAKGARGAVVWMSGLVAGLIAFIIELAMKVWGRA